MRFLVDENAGVFVGRWLREQGHEVFCVYEQARGSEDDAILQKAYEQKAYEEDWILITSDKDFGEKVYRENRLHRGIILLRLEDERSINKFEKLKQLLEAYGDQVPHRFVVVTERQVRFSGTSA
ncbi:MAG: DUF5615 family PIN-like protein [Synechococcaceae cyanobacterium SM2_3_2]|nr:DUF5615 family PIN-like protein [Synechococcaceae cyanobacterium SM2_3_2]